MFGDIFSERHPVDGHVTCKYCGKHINYHMPLATQIYCPNCWNKLDVPPINPDQVFPHKYNPETGKIIEFNEEVLKMTAKAAVEKEKQQIEQNEEPVDMLMSSYKFAKKLGNSMKTFANEILDENDKSISEKIFQDYIKYFKTI